MSTPIIPGAEPVSITGGSQGGVLLLHGYMGTVQTVRDWAMAFARVGFSVEAPLLPGHGTSADDLLDTSWSDYLLCAENAYKKLAEHHERVFVGGLCTGAMLAAWVTLNHPETTAGLMFVNGFFKVPRRWNFGLLEDMAQNNRPFFPWFRGKGVEDPNAPPLIIYDNAAIAPILSMKSPRIELWERLGEIRCPVLVFTSLLDTAIGTEDSKLWSEKISGPVEHVLLERSNHVATIDYDKGIIEDRSAAFALALAKGEH